MIGSPYIPSSAVQATAVKERSRRFRTRHISRGPCGEHENSTRDWGRERESSCEKKHTKDSYKYISYKNCTGDMNERDRQSCIHNGLLNNCASALAAETTTTTTTTSTTTCWLWGYFSGSQHGRTGPSSPPHCHLAANTTGDTARRLSTASRCL